MEYPVKCKSCSKNLYGPVKYCPFCGYSEQPSSAWANTSVSGEIVDDDHINPDNAKGNRNEPLKSNAPSIEKPLFDEQATGEAPIVAGNNNRAAGAGDEIEQKLPAQHGAGPASEKKLHIKTNKWKWLIGALFIIGVICCFSIIFIMNSTGRPTAPSHPVPSVTLREAPDSQGKNIVETINPEKKHNADTIIKKTAREDSNKRNGIKKEETEKFKPETIEEMLDKGMSLYENKQYDAAIASFKAVLKIVPGNSVAKYYLGKSMDKKEQAESRGE